MYGEGSHNSDAYPMHGKQEQHGPDYAKPREQARGVPIYERRAAGRRAGLHGFHSHFILNSHRRLRQAALKKKKNYSGKPPL